MKKRIFALLTAAFLLFCSCESLNGGETVTSDTSGSTVTTEALAEKTESTDESARVETDATEGATTDSEAIETAETVESVHGTEVVSNTEIVSNTETVHVAETAKSDAETEEKVDDGYLDLVCREPDGYEAQLFALPSGVKAISVQLPDDWTVEKRSETVFAILREGRAIGKAVSGDTAQSSAWRVVSSVVDDAGGLSITVNIEKSVSSDSYRYRICIPYEEGGEQRLLSFTVNYEELSQKSLARFSLYLRYKTIGTLPELGIIDIEKYSSENILILGNSFIGTSQVGAILQEMMNECGKSSVVHAYSRGYAHVDTYAYDESIMADIGSGYYAAVFICGFYSNEQAEHLAVMKKACDDAGVALFVFPAHNEQSGSVKYACESVEGVYLLNWKDEVQAFIDNGGDEWDFCINDAHRHSTPLAGYIGAHMIYRAVYGALPDCSLSVSISQDYVDRLLPGYSESGIVYMTRGKTIHFFG